MVSMQGQSAAARAACARVAQSVIVAKIQLHEAWPGRCRQGRRALGAKLAVSNLQPLQAPGSADESGELGLAYALTKPSDCHDASVHRRAPALEGQAQRAPVLPAAHRLQHALHRRAGQVEQREHVCERGAAGVPDLLKSSLFALSLNLGRVPKVSAAAIHEPLLACSRAPPPSGAAPPQHCPADLPCAESSLSEGTEPSRPESSRRMAELGSPGTAAMLLAPPMLSGWVVTKWWLLAATPAVAW